MKPLQSVVSIILFVVGFLPTAFAETVLWTRTIENMQRAGDFMVGSDGSVALVDLENKFLASDPDSVRSIYWYSRSGTEIATLTCDFTKFWSVVYVSERELILNGAYDGERKLMLFQFNGMESLETRVLDATGFTDNTVVRLSYPYYVKRALVEDNGDGTMDQSYTLIDLTSENSLRVVGDASIGVHGPNLQVRWKTLVNAKYQVQKSTDLQTWVDDGAILDGNGSTIVVSIPLPADADTLYARVLKL